MAKLSAGDVARMSKNINQHRISKVSISSLQNWKKPHSNFEKKVKKNASIDCGWGQVVFAHTFDSNEKIAKALCQEKTGTRNIGFYLRDPHVVLAFAPQNLFLDPSHTYRLYFEHYRPARLRPKGFLIRRAESKKDIQQINKIFVKRKMIPFKKSFSDFRSKKLAIFVAEDIESNKIIGSVLGLDHQSIFNDPEGGTSLWSLAVEPETKLVGVGEYLVRFLVESFQARSRSYLDLSVMHNNTQAIRLYEKLGFQRVPVFCVKHKNALNESLFIAPELDVKINPYGEIIINEARRRGISVNILDSRAALFELGFGGRNIRCRESLSDLTTSISLQLCDDKRLCRKLLLQSGIPFPNQVLATDSKKPMKEFLKRHKNLVVKPNRGEQGQGVSVDIHKLDDLLTAIQTAKVYSSEVLIEEMISGTDLRVVVIDHEVIAASIRVPPKVLGTGRHRLSQLIEKLSRKRSSLTDGESRIPIDAETRRVIASQGYSLDSIPPLGEEVLVRKTANLHTGGQLIDVTDELNSSISKACKIASRILQIPVVGFDLIVQDHRLDQFIFIEANERPGLANHEPQPTAERFVDLLFPQTKGKRNLERK